MSFKKNLNGAQKKETPQSLSIWSFDRATNLLIRVLLQFLHHLIKRETCGFLPWRELFEGF